METILLWILKHGYIIAICAAIVFLLYLWVQAITDWARYKVSAPVRCILVKIKRSKLHKGSKTYYYEFSFGGETLIQKRQTWWLPGEIGSAHMIPYDRKRKRLLPDEPIFISYSIVIPIMILCACTMVICS